MTEVVTGEAVVLEVPCARFPSRAVALGIDLVIQWILLIIVFVILGTATSGTVLDPAAAAALGITVSVAVIVGYPVVWETLSRGRSPGKFAMGLRVVGDDGSPERFRQALVRALAGVLEIWSLLGLPIALITSMVSAKGKRLGDIFAGTFVIQQRLPSHRAAAAPPVVAPALAQWAAALELSALTDQTAETARRYLARLPELTPTAREQVGQQIAAAVGAQVSPPPPWGTPVPAFLGAVLAERGRREHARLMAHRDPGWAAPAAAWMRPAGEGSQAGAGQPGTSQPVPGQPAAPTPGDEHHGERADQRQAGPAGGQHGAPASQPPAASGGFVPPA